MNMSEPDAFRWIQKAAMDRRLSVKEVAESIISELAEK
jgi:response regulator NasT